MNSRSPDSEEITVILIGAFNPAIFHPEWFGRQGILLPQEVESAKVKFVSPEVTEISFVEIKLFVQQERFSIETRDASAAERLLDVLVNILTALPHTPITACGINDALHFDLQDEAYWHKIGHTLAPKELVWNAVMDSPGLVSMAVKGPRGGTHPGEVHVTVGPSRGQKLRWGLLVASNYHFQPEQQHEGASAAEQVSAFLLSEWKSALAYSRTVSEHIFATIKKD